MPNWAYQLFQFLHNKSYNKLYNIKNLKKSLKSLILIEEYTCLIPPSDHIFFSASVRCSWRPESGHMQIWLHMEDLHQEFVQRRRFRWQRFRELTKTDAVFNHFYSHCSHDFSLLMDSFDISYVIFYISSQIMKIARISDV
jgi:hypothetical protein